MSSSKLSVKLFHIYKHGHKRIRCYSLKSDDPTRLIDLSQFSPDKIRNFRQASSLSKPLFFSIVAHVDHGKSTLADRLLEMAGVVKPGEREHQMLDKLQVERERGITVKAQTVALPYKVSSSFATSWGFQGYLLNMIDTPGHADFSAEVSRSLAVCDGILLLIAANQGVQAQVSLLHRLLQFFVQTIANFWLALERNVTMLPIINKIDLSGANIPKVCCSLR